MTGYRYVRIPAAMLYAVNYVYTSWTTYLKPSYFSGTLILANLARGHVIAKFNMR